MSLAHRRRPRPGQPVAGAGLGPADVAGPDRSPGARRRHPGHRRRQPVDHAARAARHRGAAARYRRARDLPGLGRGSSACAGSTGAGQDRGAAHRRARHLRPYPRPGAGRRRGRGAPDGRGRPRLEHPHALGPRPAGEGRAHGHRAAARAARSTRCGDAARLPAGPRAVRPSVGRACSGLRPPAPDAPAASGVGTAARRFAGDSGERVPLRRPHALLADAVVRGGPLLPGELPRRADGRQPRRRALRKAVVPLTPTAPAPSAVRSYRWATARR